APGDYWSWRSDTALEWRLLYGRIFKTVIILSEQSNSELAVERGQLEQAYKYLPKKFDRYTSAERFLFLQDDTILNYWNLLPADKNKLWIADQVSNSWFAVPTRGNDPAWFSSQANKMVKKVVNTMPAHFQVSYKENGPAKNSLILCSSDVFYVPRRFLGDFKDRVGLVGNLEIHHKFAIPMFFLAMDSPPHFDSVFNKMIYRTDIPSKNSSSIYSALAPAVHPWSVANEPDFIKLVRIMAEGDPFRLLLACVCVSLNNWFHCYSYGNMALFYPGLNQTELALRHMPRDIAPTKFIMWS
ncbi:hypothetical protein IFM89_038857, partial [Coptis chinensis]